MSHFHILTLQWIFQTCGESSFYPYSK